MKFQALEITYDCFGNCYELWLRSFDSRDKLYPLNHSTIIQTGTNRNILIEYAQKEYPNIYNPLTIINAEIHRQHIPVIL